VLFERLTASSSTCHRRPPSAPRCALEAEARIHRIPVGRQSTGRHVLTGAIDIRQECVDRARPCAFGP
jgi:predicted Ser/Thr protein kinase